MIDLSPDRIAAESRARIVSSGGASRPNRAVVDSRGVEAGDLFFGLPGKRTDGARFAAEALKIPTQNVLGHAGILRQFIEFSALVIRASKQIRS